MQTPKTGEPKDTFEETKCVNVMTMPVPFGGEFDDDGAWAPYKDGWIVCGAKATNRKE